MQLLRKISGNTETKVFIDSTLAVQPFIRLPALPPRSTALRQMLVPTRFSPPHPYSLDEGDAKQGGGEPGWGGSFVGRELTR